MIRFFQLLTAILILAEGQILAQTSVTLYPDIDVNVLDHPSYLDYNNPVAPVNRAMDWTWSGVPVTYRALFKLDLSTIPPGSQITTADLTLYGTDHSSLSGPNDCWLERVTEDWTETTATWNNQPTTTATDRITLAQSTSGTQNYTIDVSGFVQGWLDGDYSNYGLMLKLKTESYYRRMEFASSDHATSSKHPKLEITYTSPDQNHQVTYYPNQEWTNPATLPTSTKEQVAKTKQYIDGQGNSLQTISIEASPLGNDMVQPVERDVLGRQSKSYLPFTTGANNDGDFVTNATDPSNWTTHYGAEDDYAFAETEFETTPLSRAIKQGAVGQDWQIGSGHEIEIEYKTNSANEVFLWTVSNDQPRTSSQQYYDADDLSKVITIDEGENKFIEYKNKRGDVVLTKVQEASSPSETSHTGWACTYQVYDDIGNLRFTLTPKLMELILGSVTANYTVATSYLNNLAFQYEYDLRQRLTEQKVPSAEWNYLVYDELDRVVMTQDAVQRLSNQWSVTKYDILDRPVISGIYTHGSVIGQSAMTALISTSNFSESYNGVASTHGYTNSVWPTTGVEVLSVTYYDNYDFLTISGWDAEGNSYGYQNPGSPYESTYFSSVKGETTGSKVKIVGTGNYLNTVTYFDDRYQPIQIITENHKGTRDVVSNHYDFNGNILNTRSEHKKGYDIVWTDVVSLDASANNLKRLSGSGWNAGAASDNILSANKDGWIEMTAAETSTNRMFGLSTDNSSASWNTIDYAIYLRSNGTAQVRQSGSGSLAQVSYQIGDVFRIERTGSTLYYKKNGIQFKTSSISSSSSYIADVSIHTKNGTIRSAYASFGIPNQEDSNLLTTEHSYDYDHMDRLLEVSHQTDSDPKVDLAKYSYNELGELEEKDLHSTDNWSTRMQSVDYGYSIRGWLTGINNAQLSPTGINNDSDDYFGLELGYENSLSSIGASQLFNGNISAAKWSVKHSSNNTVEAGYGYGYDRLNRLTSADYNRKTTSWSDVTHYNLESVGYDLNGNIENLTRRNLSGTNMDVLTYNYGSGTTYSNQLNYINDTGVSTEGFKNANTGTDDYDYDLNGNLTKDLNRGITSISYNYLNLPDVVTIDADNYLKYYYDAAGTRLRSELYQDGIATKITDYIGETLVKNNLITEIYHDEGRIVPHRDELGDIEEYRYQYHLTDHLGNARVTFGEEKTDSNTATMEILPSDRKEKEEVFFNNILETRFTHSSANNTSGGNQVSRLNNTQPIGPALSLAVYPGDEVDMDVYAYYETSSGYGSQIATTTWVNELAAAFGGASGAPGEAGAIYDGINAISAGSLFGGSNGSSVPAAYLNYILFDQGFNYITNGHVSISSSAHFAKEHLVQSTVTVTQPGYIFVYVSNESNSSNWTFFDDLTVSLTTGEIKQETHYYPYGLAMADIGKQGSNAFTYQTKEWQSDLDLELYDFHARQFDPTSGRFFGVDPAGQFYSDYVGMGNNPVIGVDPDGELVWLLPVAIGAAVNTVGNWDHISSADNFWDGLGLAAQYATVGGLQGATALVGGPAGLALGGAIGGLGNGLIQGLEGNALLSNVGIGAASGLFGGVAAQRATRFIGGFKSPLLDGLAKGAAGGLVGGFVGGGTASTLSGGDFWEGAIRGAGQGALFGATIGGAVSSYGAYKQGFNPLSGLRTQKWLSENQVPGTIRVRHHTNLQGVNKIRRSGKIKFSRPYDEPGVHVEMPPFEYPSQLPRTGKGGYYVEFSHPEINIKAPPGFIGKGNAGKIPTTTPLNIQQANPDFYYGRWGWLRWIK